MIGQCGITMQEYKTAQVPEIGYLLAHKYWHKGYAVEAATACREYGVIGNFVSSKIGKVKST